jgi:predicted restriction endonuclease
MAVTELQEVPDWRDPAAGGGLVRGALWLLKEVGVGNVFTKGQLRAAFPDIAQIDRRIRDLRDYGWVIDTSREDVTLDQSQQRLVKQGISVWDPEERKKRTGHTALDRIAALHRADYACELCGRSSDAGVRLELTHRRALSQGGEDSPENLTVLCSACHAAQDRALGVTDLAAQASALPVRERTRLLTWITMGERPRTTVEDIWARYQQLPTDDQQQLARHLARLLNEDTAAEDASS